MEWGNVLPFLTVVVTSVGLIVAAFWSLMRWSNASASELLDAKLLLVTNQIDALDHNVNAKIDALDRNVNAKIDALDRNVNTRIDALASQVAEIAESNRSMRAKLDDVSERVARIEERVGIPAEPVSV